MNFSIRKAESLEEYLESWKRAMRDTYWFRERRLFDYHSDEMMEEIRLEFENPHNIYLVAKSGRRKETVGVLEVRAKNKVGTLGRWEPAVSLKCRDSGVGEALLEKAFALLREQCISKTRCILKFPYNQSETARWHLKLYQEHGFVIERSSAILLLADLSKATKKTLAIASLHMVDGSDFSLEEYADFTQRAYLSTPQDRAVHQSDPYVSNRENVLKTLGAIKSGKFGCSPPECWRVAKLKDDTAGFIIAFMQMKSKYQPSRGVIAELGVFPQFRKRGIAMSLIDEVFKCFRRHGCNYSFVGTPKANKAAITLYKKMGHTPAFEQIDFQRTL